MLLFCHKRKAQKQKITKACMEVEGGQSFFVTKEEGITNSPLPLFVYPNTN
jgi:hypothetical protein